MAKKSEGPEVLRRLSAKLIMGRNIGDIVKEANGDAVDLYNIYGIAMGIKVKETQFGESTGAVGQFEAVRLEDGVVFMGNTAYLPEPAGSALIEQLKARTDQNTSVQFGCTIGVKPSKKSAVGYEYTWKPLLKPEQREALSALRGEFKGLLENKG